MRAKRRLYGMERIAGERSEGPPGGRCAPAWESLLGTCFLNMLVERACEGGTSAIGWCDTNYGRKRLGKGCGPQRRGLNAIETEQTNGGWNCCDWMQWANCVRRRVVIASGRSEENDRRWLKAHCPEPGRGELHRFRRAGYASGAPHHGTQLRGHNQIGKFDEARGRSSPGHQAADCV